MDLAYIVWRGLHEAQSAVWTPELKLEQGSKPYMDAEQQGNREACWVMLLKRLRSRAAEPVEARKQAQGLWNAWRWNGDIYTFNVDAREAVAACERNHVPKHDYDIVMRYLELLFGKCAVWFEDDGRTPEGG